MRCDGYDLELYRIAEDFCKELKRFNQGLVWAIKGHQTAKYFMGLEYERIGDYKEALKWYKDVVEPKNWMIGKSYRANMSSVLGKKSTTLRLFKEAAEEYCSELDDMKYILKA